MSDPRGALLAGLRRAYSVNDDKLRGARVLAGARARRDQNDHSGLLDALRKFNCVRHAQGSAGGAGQPCKRVPAIFADMVPFVLMHSFNVFHQGILP